MFTDATTTEFSSIGQGDDWQSTYPARYDKVDFTTNDWTDASFTGSRFLNGATSPDETISDRFGTCIP